MINVGLIGANPDRGWATTAHLPALGQLDDYNLVAVATSRTETAERATEIYGAARGYASASALIEDRDVELVVVTVKVPLHREMVVAALGAGKHVLCEWPLGNGTAEAQALVDAAVDSPGRAFTGLQARCSPSLTFVHDLVADGYVGEVLSSTVVASGYGWGAAIDEAQAYLFDAHSGASMLSVTGGHLLDAVRWCLGDLAEVTATIAQRRTEVAILSPSDVGDVYCFRADLDAPTGQPGLAVLDRRRSSVPDQVGLTARTADGAVVVVHLRGGQFRSTNLLWEINGTRGDLLVTGRAGTMQMQDVHVQGARGASAPVADLALPARYLDPRTADLVGPARNVALLYRDLARDLDDGGRRCPDFSTALQLHRLLDQVETAAHRSEPR